MALNSGNFASFLYPRAYLTILDACLVVLIGEEECYWHLLLIYNEQDATTIKIHWVQNGNILKVNNPDLVCQSLFLCSNWHSWFFMEHLTIRLCFFFKLLFLPCCILLIKISLLNLSYVFYLGILNKYFIACKKFNISFSY